MVQETITIELYQRIEIVVEGDKHLFEVDDIKDDGIVISRVNIDEVFKALVPLTLIELYVGGRGKGVSYKCESRVINAITHKNLKMYTISFPVAVACVNRRDHCRFFLQEPLPMTLIDVDKIDKVYNGVIINISAGGLRIESDIPDAVKLVNVKFSLDTRTFIEAECITLSKVYREFKGEKDHYLKFNKITNRNVDKIVEYIFRKSAEKPKAAR